VGGGRKGRKLTRVSEKRIMWWHEGNVHTELGCMRRETRAAGASAVGVAEEGGCGGWAAVPAVAAVAPAGTGLAALC